MKSSASTSRLLSALAVAYLAVLHLILGSLFLNNPTMSKLKSRLGISVSDFQPEMLQYQKWMDGSIPNGSNIFLGDSITQGLAATAISPNSVNLGIGHLSTSQLLYFMPNYKSLERAGRVYLMIGANDLLRGEQAGLEQRYQHIADALPKDAPVVWTAVMPINTAKVKPAAIEAANDAARAICQARVNCRFVLMQTALATKDGAPIADLFQADGIHLKTAGYTVWIDALKKATD